MRNFSPKYYIQKDEQHCQGFMASNCTCTAAIHFSFCLNAFIPWRKGGLALRWFVQRCWKVCAVSGKEWWAVLSEGDTPHTPQEAAEHCMFLKQ